MICIGFCIATMGDNRYGLGDGRFEGCVDVYMPLLFSHVLSSTKNNLITVTVITFPDDKYYLWFPRVTIHLYDNIQLTMSGLCDHTGN